MKPVSTHQAPLEVEAGESGGVRRELLEYLEANGLTAGRLAPLARIELRHDLLSEAEVLGEKCLFPKKLSLMESWLGLRGFREVGKRVCARARGLVRLSEGFRGSGVWSLRGFAQLRTLANRGVKRQCQECYTHWGPLHNLGRGSRR